MLYFGTDERWTAPKRLFGCFDVPKELRPYVNDYKIKVFEIAWLNNKTIDLFQSDFRFLAKFFRAKRLNKKYIGSKEKIEHVEQTLKMFSALTGDDSFERIYNDNDFRKKGGVTMCDVVDRIREEGKEEIIRKLIESEAGSIEQIATWVKLPVAEVKKIAKKVPVLN